MRYFLLFFVLIFSGSLVQAQENGNWSIDQFLLDLQNSKPKTIEDALLSLPDEVRSNFTLLYQAHGLRQTSYSLPGVILFSDEGKYAITFGDKSMSLGDELEVARFIDGEARFEYFRAVFPPEGSRGQITVEKNPPVCLQCHSQDPRFLWASYDRWPGVYGSIDDVIDSTVPEIKEESDQFIAFKSKMNQMERYRTLRPVIAANQPGDDNSPVSPYTTADRDRRMQLRPNFRFSLVVARQDARRLARKLMESPFFRTYQRQLLSYLIGCSSAGQASSTQTPLSFESLVTLLGADFSDFQPNLLDPLQPGVIPRYYDGGSPPNALGDSSIVAILANLIYLEVLKSDSDATLQSAYSSKDATSPQAITFGEFYHYPESMAFFAKIDKLAIPLDPYTFTDPRPGPDVCADLKKN